MFFIKLPILTKTHKLIANLAFFSAGHSITDQVLYHSDTSGQYYNLFPAVITPLAAYSSVILTELRR